MYRSAVTKLTIYYVALLVALALVFSVTLYYVDHQEIAASLKSQVQKFDKGGDYDKDSQEIYNVILKERSRNFAIKVFYYDIGFILASIVIANLLARQTLKPIRRAHEEQIKFIADASHQLKTPLANMQLSAELNLTKVNRQSKNDYEHTIKQSIKDIQGLNKLTDSLMNISRHQSSLSQLDIQRVEMKSLIDNSISELNNLALKRKITIESDLHRAYAYVDKTAFQQVFSILIENAIKYSRSNSLVEVSMLNDYRKIVVKIVDQGIGIKQSDLKKIFRPFYRSSHSVTNEANGFGLGLPLAKQITELHGGKITVRSEFDRGSVFTVEIPRHAKTGK